ncbi:MAG TPA: FAD-dependent oxidoreductase [Thermoanaerobaculia bacterium]|nr:FAD-dependent oxidoreductase [Thermoanaerobaculia bacterium]
MERYNLVVIGGGSGGLVVAAGGAGLGARVALAEKHVLPYAPPGGAAVQGMGGDCLQYGCVPSKALLAAAKAVHAARGAGRFGIRGVADPGPQDLDAVMDRVRAAQAAIAPNDSVERFTGLGVDVLLGAARLKSAHEVEVAGTTVWGRHVVVATGSRPRVPRVPGLPEAGFLTNESIFDLRALPKRLLVMGGGPIGVELGQAFRRLGSEVTIVSSSTLVCPKEDADVTAVLEAGLRAEGVVIHDEAIAASVAVRGGAKVVTVRKKDGTTLDVEADAILVATGRKPNVEGLDLEAAGVAFSEKGILTDAKCRTNVPSVWAIGDVAGPYLFTHWAGYQAGIVLRNTLSPVALAKCDALNTPWITYTDPEIARVGLSEADAKAQGIPHRVFRAGFAHNDRAVCDGTGGANFMKAVVDPKGRILGAAIVHPHAGDLLGEVVLAKKNGLPLSALGTVIHAYPSLSEIHGAVAREALKTALTPGRKALLAKLAAFLRR